MTMHTGCGDVGVGDWRKYQATVPAAQTPITARTAVIGNARQQESDSQRTGRPPIRIAKAASGFLR
jgi:hypothetical protein